MHDLDFSSLDWKKVPDRDHDFINEYFEFENKFYESQENLTTKFRKKKDIRLNEGLSIHEAKTELSKHYEIPEDSIEIHIKG